MSLQKTILTCGLVVLGALGIGCGSNGSLDTPAIGGVLEYGVVFMDNGQHVQYYGETEYTITSYCVGATKTRVERDSDPAAVWFDFEIEYGPHDEVDTVTLRPEQDGPWSARVGLYCEKSTGETSPSRFMNVCYMGPCSTGNK
ncbi:MAG: hypothetical protein AAF799_47180 [Myxococcota bacterium]